MPLTPQDYRDLVRLVAAEQAKRSSSAFFFTGEDRLRLRTFGSLAGVVVAVEGRMLTVQGDPVPFGHAHVPTSDRTVATTLHDLGEGFLLHAQLRASTGAPRRGQVYAILDVVRGLGATVQPVAVLCSDYVTDTTPIGWPGSALRASSEGPGVIRSITGTDPAAGVEITETVPTNARWRLMSARIRLTADATVVNRELQFYIDGGGTDHLRIVSGYGQTATQIWTYSFAPHLVPRAVVAANVTNSGCPDVFMAGGHRFGTDTASLQAGDNYAAPQFLVEEWIED